MIEKLLFIGLGRLSDGKSGVRSTLIRRRRRSWRHLPPRGRQIRNVFFLGFKPPNIRTPKDFSHNETHKTEAFPAGEGADQRMRREADEGYAQTASSIREHPFHFTIAYLDTVSSICVLWRVYTNPSKKCGKAHTARCRLSRKQYSIYRLKIIRIQSVRIRRRADQHLAVRCG